MWAGGGLGGLKSPSHSQLSLSASLFPRAFELDVSPQLLLQHYAYLPAAMYFTVMVMDSSPLKL